MMSKIDVYTKFILTIIAVCLVWICMRDIDLIPKAYASSADDIVDVRIKAIERTSGEKWDYLFIDSADEVSVEVVNNRAIPVEVKNELVPVDVKNVEVKKSLTPIK